jgi:hypothetical protein
MTTTVEPRDERFTHWNADGTIYDCADDGFICELETMDGLVTCVHCGDRPHVRYPPEECDARQE